MQTMNTKSISETDQENIRINQATKSTDQTYNVNEKDQEQNKQLMRQTQQAMRRIRNTI